MMLRLENHFDEPLNYSAGGLDSIMRTTISFLGALAFQMVYFFCHHKLGICDNFSLF